MEVQCTIDDIHGNGRLSLRSRESLEVGKAVEVSTGYEKCSVKLSELKAAIACMDK